MVIKNVHKLMSVRTV